MAPLPAQTAVPRLFGAGGAGRRRLGRGLRGGSSGRCGKAVPCICCKGFDTPEHATGPASADAPLTSAFFLWWYRRSASALFLRHSSDCGPRRTPLCPICMRLRHCRNSRPAKCMIRGVAYKALPVGRVSATGQLQNARFSPWRLEGPPGAPGRPSRPPTRRSRLASPAPGPAPSGSPALRLGASTMALSETIAESCTWEMQCLSSSTLGRMHYMYANQGTTIGRAAGRPLTCALPPMPARRCIHPRADRARRARALASQREDYSRASAATARPAREAGVRARSRGGRPRQPSVGVASRGASAARTRTTTSRNDIYDSL